MALKVGPVCWCFLSAQGQAAVLDVGPHSVLHTHLIMDGLQAGSTECSGACLDGQLQAKISARHMVLKCSAGDLCARVRCRMYARCKRAT